MKPEYLCRWLEPARDYLAGRGFTLPPSGESAPLDYERLASIFMEPDAGMPRELAHSASLIHEMSTEAAMNDLLEGTRHLGVELPIGDDPDPVDVAVQVWLVDPKILEELHQMHQLDRPRGFVHFVTDRLPVPAFEEPTAGQLADLEANLANWFYHAKRGRHAKVWMYRRPGEYWFLVRHGLPSRREEVMSGTGADTLLFRPSEYDVVVYNRKNGELRVHGCSAKEVEILRLIFGKHVFHDENFFPGGARFTLAPLVEKGRDCLACHDIPGIEHVTLTEVQAHSGGRDWLRVTHQSGDLFNAIEQGRVVLSDASSLVRAGFLVRFSDSKKQRMVKIIGSNKLSVVRDGDTALIERWMTAQGFVKTRQLEEHEAEEALAGV